MPIEIADHVVPVRTPENPFHIADALNFQRKEIRTFPGTRNSDFAHIFRALTQASLDDDTFALFSNMITVIGRFLAPEIGKLTSISTNSQRFTRLFTWLNDQPLATVTIADAADLYELTPSAFSKRFRCTMGISFGKFMASMQVRRAQEKLLYTDATVIAIAKSLGYDYPQYFHRFFQKYNGCTPLQYRSRNRLQG